MIKRVEYLHATAQEIVDITGGNDQLVFLRSGRDDHIGCGAGNALRLKLPS
jgi:hypothetical protein